MPQNSLGPYKKFCLYQKNFDAGGPLVSAWKSGEDAETHPQVGGLIRARRRQLHMTLQALGEASSVSVGYLSQVERNHATPTLGTLAQIARALGVGIDYFIATPSIEDALTRAGERRSFSVEGSSIRYERIGADFAGNILSSFILPVPPGYRSEIVSHEGEEIIYILSGEIHVTLEGEEMVLRDGDGFHFRGNRPHAWANPGKEPARILWTGTIALFRSLPEGNLPGETLGKPASKGRARATRTSNRKGNAHEDA